MVGLGKTTGVQKTEPLRTARTQPLRPLAAQASTKKQAQEGKISARMTTGTWLAREAAGAQNAAPKTAQLRPQQHKKAPKGNKPQEGSISDRVTAGTWLTRGRPGHQKKKKNNTKSPRPPPLRPKAAQEGPREKLTRQGKNKCPSDRRHSAGQGVATGPQKLDPKGPPDHRHWDR